MQCTLRDFELRHIAYPRAHAMSLALEIAACDACIAARLRQQRRQHFDHRRLAGAILSNQPKNFAEMDLEIDTVNDGTRVEDLGDFPGGYDCGRLGDLGQVSHQDNVRWNMATRLFGGVCEE